MISNSGSDERGKYSGGQAGDQTGNEWRVQPWYSRPWSHVLRHPDAEVRDLIATLAEEAAANDRIGYDQAQRTTFWAQLKLSGYHPKNIVQPCEADCSAGVAAIVKAAGYLLNDTRLKNVSADMYTGNERFALNQAGFQVFTDPKYLTSEDYLLRGDVLLYEYHHTAINLTDGKQSSVGGWHWVQSGGKWYYQDANGANSYGWKRINETEGEYSHWYYFNTRGQMLTGLQIINLKRYYLMESGDLEGAMCSTDNSGALDVMYLAKV